MGDPLPEAHLQILAETFKLDGFFKRPKTRQTCYFELVDYLGNQLRAITRQEPLTTAVRECCAPALLADNSFVEFVAAYQNASMLIEEEPWMRIARAGAGALLRVHQSARRRGDWP